MAPIFSAEDKALLLDLARQSIEHGLNHDRPLAIALENYPEHLHAWHASFVTLYKNKQLRGCIGHLEAIQPLLQDIVENAYSAAFKDHRFAPLDTKELPALEISLAILSAPEPLQFDSEAELLSIIQPGIDGLILEDKHHRGTFLPSVWDSLPKPADFLRELKRKAGLPVDFWSDTIQVSRYTTQQITTKNAK